MTAPATFSPALRAELGKLDVAQILSLLGEIVEPSIYTPFDYDEDFQEGLGPVTSAYQDAYKSLACIVAGEHGDPEAAYWNEADYRYDESRDARADFNSPVIL